MAAAGNFEVTDQLLKGVELSDRTYKNHLDGYNQLDLLQGNGPSARDESSTSVALSSVQFALATSSSSSINSRRVGQVRR